MSELTFPEVLVTDKAVYFDGSELPWYIAERGIQFEPGGNTDVNRLTVEFLVGETTFRSQWDINHDGEWQWLKRAVELEARVQNRAFDVIAKEYSCWV